jgi:23S rRNA (uridine2552-2'-O)-methyltransferase
MPDEREVAARRSALLTFAVATYERKDAVYRRAKREGLRSRAAFKLAELDDHFGLLKRGIRVVDLGCWPGGWLEVCAERVGPGGRVVGVDVAETAGVAARNVTLLTADVYDDALVDRVRDALGGPADVVLSDLAPKLSGIATTDSARHADLVLRALALARAWLRPPGALLVKLFMDAEYQALIRELRAAFATVKSRKLETTRRGSAELYACGRGLKEPTPTTESIHADRLPSRTAGGLRDPPGWSQHSCSICFIVRSGGSSPWGWSCVP